MGYKTCKVRNLVHTFSNSLFIDMNGMTHMNIYLTKFFRPLSHLNLLVTLHQMQAQKVRKIEEDNFTQTPAKTQWHVSNQPLPQNNYKSGIKYKLGEGESLAF